MLLYLARHGEASHDGGEDSARHLTKRGQTEVRRMAEKLAQIGVRTDLVQHSGLVRARQTAEVLHGVTGGDLQAASGLTPLDNVAAVARQLDPAVHRSVMLVGHQPFMGRMAAYLLSGDADADFIRFRTASVACLSGFGPVWQLEWLLEPKIV